MEEQTQQFCGEEHVFWYNIGANLAHLDVDMILGDEVVGKAPYFMAFARDMYNPDCCPWQLFAVVAVDLLRDSWLPEYSTLPYVVALARATSSDDAPGKYEM